MLRVVLSPQSGSPRNVSAFAAPPKHNSARNNPIISLKVCYGSFSDLQKVVQTYKFSVEHEGWDFRLILTAGCGKYCAG